MTLALVLALPTKSEEYDLFIKASYKGLGVLLIQRGKMIPYISCQLKDYETRYLTHNLNLAVAMFALKM